MRAGHDLEQLPEHLHLGSGPATLLSIGWLKESASGSSERKGRTGAASTGALWPPGMLSTRFGPRWPAAADIAGPAVMRACRGAIGIGACALPAAVG